MIEYKVLKEISSNPSHTQRTLATKLNVSLGKVNYVLSGLVDKGIIKAKKLRDDPASIRWNYILTPKGIKEKLRITKSYLDKRLEEFHLIKEEIQELEKEVNEEYSQKN